MNSYFTWIFLLTIQVVYVTSRPFAIGGVEAAQQPYQQDNANYEGSPNPDNEKVISVRITSSVAIGRGKGKSTQRTREQYDSKTEFGLQQIISSTQGYNNKEEKVSNLEGANIEFIKQLNAKKESKDSNLGHVHPYQIRAYQHYNESDYNNEKVNYGNKNEVKGKEENSPLPDNVPSSSQDVTYYKEIGKFETSVLNEALKYSNERLTFNATNDLLARAESKKITEVTIPSTELAESYLNYKYYNETDDSIAEPSIKSALEIADKNNENYKNIENIPLARSVAQSPSSKNFIQGLTNKPPSERESSTRLTTVSFNIVHDTPKLQPNTYNAPTNEFVNPNQNFMQDQKFYEPPKVYSQPAQVYSKPAKFYSEPAKIYSEPAKVYSEPAKIYSEPAKIYSEPAKFYSEPASLHLNDNIPPNYTPWQQHSQGPSSVTVFNTTPVATITMPGAKRQPSSIPEHQPERNYEVDENVSVLTDGRSYGVQESSTEKCKQDNCKVGYVVKGRQYNKYRVEERTSDGFIVGEYGVVRNEDGALRGVRYTADSEASPRLIYDALMKFLQLK